MRKEQRLKKNSDFSRVYNDGLSCVNRLLVMRAMRNGLQIARFGFSVGRRIGTAVIRNRVKRLLRESVRQEATKQGWDVVFVARPPTAIASYQGMRQSVHSLLQKGKLLDQENAAAVACRQEGKP